MEIKKYICAECGKEFEREKAKRGGHNRKNAKSYCTPECSRKFWNRHAWDKHRLGDVVKNCVTCGKEFTAHRLHHSQQVCCSLPCRTKENARVRSEKRRAAIPEKLNCLKCQVEFKPKQKSERYCSRKCYRNSCQQRYRTKYPEKCLEADRKRRWGGNWYAAMERDGWTCQICKGTDRSKLIVHHLDGEGEAHAKNHELSNLQVLCGKCHHTIAHSHSAAFKVAGELCTWIDGVQYTLTKKQ